MATKTYTIWSFLVLALMLSRGATAQSGCSNNMINGLSSCISYLRGNSSRPLPSCCTSLANVQQAQPKCICPLLSNNGASATLGIAINRTLAMAMPATCKLRTPQCDGTFQIYQLNGTRSAIYEHQFNYCIWLDKSLLRKFYQRNQ